MKKLTRKLFLSVAALGACAVTLVSTTFAWYTTNTSVDVSNVGALTEAAADGSQLYVAYADEYGDDKIADTFSEYTAVASPVQIYDGTVTLTPVSHNGADGYQTIAKTTQNYNYTVIDLTDGFTEGERYYSRAGNTYTLLGTATNVDDEVVLVLDGRDENVEFDFTKDYYVEGPDFDADAPVYVLADIYGEENYIDGPGEEVDGFYTLVSDESYTTIDTAAVEYNKYETYYIEDDTQDSGYRAATDTDFTTTDGVTDWTEDVTYYQYNKAVYAKATMFVRGIAYYTRVRSTDDVTYADENPSHFIEYVLRFRTTTENTNPNGMPIYVSNISVLNTGYGSSSQTALQTEGQTGIKTKGLYNIDVLKAMKMDVYVTYLSNAQGEDSTKDANGNAAGASDRAETYATYAFTQFVSDENVDVNIATSGANAVGYYNAVTGANINRAENYDYANLEVKELTTKSKTGGAAVLFSIPQNMYYVEVRFVFYLDGWDEYCYDVCRQQGFQIAMSFSTEINENVLYNHLES